ncbi:copper resistance system multicopper oxidase [Herminiimonas fonticola]|uniref:CopA family copper-resistance protein n=1 Tax=Herminiimonas fonticola TaxID=303380 RepID=A0A4R6FZE4_9BURK|nr:copper resistance system multicopper oxidase [Herminiimonas fonticola]RBA22872.1 copper-resistance protein, CopA family [Herminiimonas fonticola]TDN87277.1 CopA family copper-resistance protein [Herminiimonas fonticola]
MSRRLPLIIPPSGMGRRRFVQGLVAGGVLASLSSPVLSALTNSNQLSQGTAPILRGNEFDLVVNELPVNFTGKPGMATTINGSIPAPTLRWREGETVTIRVHNKLREHTSIHWHGIILPYQMDGVPGISFAGIPPGATFTYRFKVQQSGTYWYHSHSGMQELTGMYGAIIIDPAGPETIRADRDHVVLLSDWTDEDPMRVFAKLKAQGDYYNYNQPTVIDFFRDAARDGVGSAFEKRKMWNEMRMNPTDLADLSSQTLTYLTNGITPAGNWTALFRPGERVRLRMINGAGNTFYDVRIPGLKLKVVHVDGLDVEPVTVDEFRFGPGETIDVIVEPLDEAYTIFAQSMERTGFALATLAVREGLKAPVPKLDPVEWLTMRDMMGSMEHGAMSGGSMAGMDHSGMTGMNMMDHSSMSTMDSGDMTGMTGMNGMDHSVIAGMDHSAMKGMTGLAVPSTTARHARTEYGASTDMRVDMARSNLDDPGIGLRNNGRRVLTLADLHTPSGPMDKRGPSREVELHLTGNMERYSWSFDGVEFGKSTPVHFRHGERLRVILHNDTMMTHPMHLHGMWSELESPDGKFQVRRHTLPVQPAQRISFLVTADAVGRWAWHCHLMFHMDGGMFREVVVS